MVFGGRIWHPYSMHQRLIATGFHPAFCFLQKKRNSAPMFALNHCVSGKYKIVST